MKSRTRTVKNIKSYNINQQHAALDKLTRSYKSSYHSEQSTTSIYLPRHIHFEGMK